MARLRQLEKHVACREILKKRCFHGNVLGCMMHDFVVNVNLEVLSVFL